VQKYSLTAQNIATQTVALCGQISDPINLKQSVNINIAEFSGNQTYVFEKNYASYFLRKIRQRRQRQLFSS
jgi:hypothetical protein